MSLRCPLLVFGVIAAAVVLTACTAAAPASTRATPTPAESDYLAQYSAKLRADSLITPQTTAPATTELTAPGTALALGAWAVIPVAYSPDDEHSTAGLTVVSVEQGQLTDFAKFPKSDVKKLGDVVPYYVHTEYTRLAGDTLRVGITNDLQLIGADGDSADVPVVIGTNQKKLLPECVPQPVLSDIHEKVGDYFAGCKVFLLPSGVAPSTVSWSQDDRYANAAIRWDASS